MLAAEWTTLFCWLVFVAYWLVSAKAVKPIQETRGWLGGNWYRLLLTLGVVCMLNLRFMGRLGIPVEALARMPLPRSAELELAGALLTSAGLALAIISRRTLAQNWSAAVALKHDHELVTRGVYRFVRHPIYSGILLMVVGTTLTADTSGACLGFAVIALAIVLKLKDEEALLTEHFGEVYREYREHTRILIPFIW